MNVDVWKEKHLNIVFEIYKQHGSGIQENPIYSNVKPQSKCNSSITSEHSCVMPQGRTPARAWGARTPG